MSRMGSVMRHSFSDVPRANIPRSSFNRSSAYKTTFDADYLIPIFVDDVVPGDTFNLNFKFFARLATPLHPIMDNMFFDTFWFFVPNRLVWPNWEKMHGAQDNPNDSIDFTVPTYTNTGAIANDSLWDYWGIPTGITNAYIGLTALPARAYNLIWNEWFRDQNLQDSLTVDLDDGPDNPADYVLKKRGKRHDYFTSALPWPQKGDAVSLPLGTQAPISGIGVAAAEVPGGAVASLKDATGTGLTYNNTFQFDNDSLHARADGSSGSALPDVYADLSSATAATINDLRLAFQTQRLLERDARSGTRYNELILSHFGVTVPDFRVQRPEYLGGGSTPINVTPVAQTSGQPVPAADDKLGQLGGFGTVMGRHGFTKSFVEHGMVIGLINVRSDITYSQGIERYWNKSTRFDFYYPVLAQIGEQSILNREIFYQDAAADDNVFGYQERYAEYRYKPSRLTSLMRPDRAGTLASWHLSEDFSTLPTLGDTFIQSNTGTPLDRAIQINTEPHFILDSRIELQCARPMPINGVPGNLDHF